MNKVKVEAELDLVSCPPTERAIHPYIDAPAIDVEIPRLILARNY